MAAAQGASRYNTCRAQLQSPPAVSFSSRHEELEERLVVAGAEETTGKGKTGETGGMKGAGARNGHTASVELSGAVDVVGHAHAPASRV